MENKYNGWTNYETWNVNLWMDNDGTSEYINELAAQAYRDAEPSKYSTRAQVAASALAEQIKDHIEENNPLTDSASMFSDLLTAALEEVNWYEIATTYIDELDKSEFDNELEGETA